MSTSWIKKTGQGLLAAALATSLSVQADSRPGEGVTVTPLKSSIAEETFQTLLVSRALEELGFTVEDIRELEYPAAHIAIANGDGTFLADHWYPMHIDFYEKAGGDDKLFRSNVFSGGALSGYLIDKKTADEHNITHIDQLKDPEIAKVFDADGNGKADLTGCPPGWGCEQIIEHHMDAYGLRDTVDHNQGSYSALMAGTIAQFNKGEPVLYYTWVPYWVSAVMKPGEDVVWLQVPFSALPGERGEVDTSLPDGSNFGFQANTQRIVANRDFVEKYPSVKALFNAMEVSSGHISAQNLAMRNGQDSDRDIERHTDQWIKANRETFDRWLAAARAAAR
ncbi:glycine betaine/L-proline ABC transporter substrate-binding protein ProX [Marinobacter sp. X15-166B]|uniref:glycine betaine/L-proline ABC transporter substrate-binding protein ProX n=1 Tax=Marinobacter sp. X15-166B TaxID=1897620 RepID=UPI00085CC1C4|nr:glycine betaine/L-proline ABC transporter substrate-binding protein ProX [Marinobacter sp. X15-166B]OEY66369.1 glycine betaine ABC transporter substrate-binding protein [Marinobacter sp. X15-166B]